MMNTINHALPNNTLSLHGLSGQSIRHGTDYPHKAGNGALRECSRDTNGSWHGSAGQSLVERFVLGLRSLLSFLRHAAPQTCKGWKQESHQQKDKPHKIPAFAGMTAFRFRPGRQNIPLLISSPGEEKARSASGGFSLVELSIVLVVLGLLTGGILTGQNLIRAAELRASTSQLTGYQAAILSFQDGYLALPGDMRNATVFWGAVGGGGGTGAGCFNAESTTNATCNGNGDGYINTADGGGSTPWEYGERWHAWKQLANAGMVEGAYTGKSDHATDANTRTPGKNLPRGKAGNAYVALVGSVNTNANFYPAARNTNYLVVDDDSSGGPFTPEEMWNIDKKLDDGLPAYGKIQSHVAGPTGTWAPDCATSDDEAIAKYDLINNGKVCILLFLLK